MAPQGKSGKMEEEKEPLPLPQTKPKEASITAGKSNGGSRRRRRKPPAKGEGDAASKEEKGSASLREKEEEASTRQGGAAFVAIQADPPTGKKAEGEKPDLGARKKSSNPRKKEEEEEEEGSASLREKEEASTPQGSAAFVAVQVDLPTEKMPEGEKPGLGARKKSTKAREKKKKEEREKGKEVGGGSPNGRRGLAGKGSEGEEEGICAPRGAAPAPAPRRGRPSCPALLPQAQAQAQAEGQPLRQVLERLRLAQERRSEAAQLVNGLRDRLVKAIKKAPCFKDVEILGTGSYYERVKICRPNEFDIMLKVPKVRVELEPCKAGASSGAFYYVKLKRDCANKELKEFCDDDERLSSSNMLLKLRSIITEEVKKMKDMDVSVERKRPGCPAVTLLIGKPPSVISVDIILGLEFYHSKWFAGTENGLGIEKWLGTKVKKSLRFEPLYLVPKNVKDGQHFIDTWRLSFSKIEKIILNNHGQTKTCCEIKGVKCCRKDCLKLLKYLLEQLKTKHEDRNQFDKFCSYQVKTAFFHACVMWPKDDDWLPTNLDECFMRLLNYFLNCLREAKLPHFFIRTFNFFCEERIERTKRNALIRAIEREINNRYPAFFDS